jgi:hypothetical protein
VIIDDFVDLKRFGLDSDDKCCVIAAFVNIRTLCVFTFMVFQRTFSF